MENNLIYIPLGLSIVGLLFMLVKMAWVRKQPAGDDKMQGIARNIKEGAMAFLSAEYRLLLIFVLLGSGALFGISKFVPTTHWLIVPAFIIGRFFQRWREISECVLPLMRMLERPRPQKHPCRMR